MKRKEDNNMDMKDIRIFLNMKNKSWLSIEKIILKSGKRFTIIRTYNSFSSR